jgi:mono/diheme cytochrome c family protein
VSVDEDRRVSQGREREEPEELRNPTPWPLIALSVVLIGWGLWYYFDNAGFPLAAGDRRTPIVEPGLDDVDGARVYAANCVACHQADGQGAGGVFPPLAQARWVVGSPERLVQIMLYGIQGPIEVRGTVYDGVMPAFARLSDAELAAVTSHIRSSWGNAASPIRPEDVAAGRQRDPGRTSPWAGGEELDAVLGDG